VSIAKWNLKEAGGKGLSLRTETAYEAQLMWVMLQKKQKPYYCTEHHSVNAEAT
jgi:hypothetical protein